jgi:hypothetical protein
VRDMPPRRDHLATWLMVTPILVYGFVAMTAFVALVTPGPGGTAFGLVLPAGIAALYAAAAILQLSYGWFKSWRASWGQGLGLAWFGGLALFTVGGFVRAFRSGGLSAVQEILPGTLLTAALFLAAWLVGMSVRWTFAFVRGRLHR